MTTENQNGAYANIKDTEGVLHSLNAFVPRIDTVIHATGAVVDILRLDEIHPYVNGNKWYKLKHNLNTAIEQKADTLITFGGAFSNHLVATAAAAQLLGMKCICIVRGEAPAIFNIRLLYIQQTGAVLHFVPRYAYSVKQDSPHIQDIIKQYPNSYIIPEGGANALGVQGCRDILHDIHTTYDIIACAAGTGTMAAGIIDTASAASEVMVFPVIKIPDGNTKLSPLYTDISNYLNNQLNNWSIINGYSFGGYAKHPEELIHFVDTFNRQYQILLDTVYNGKLLYGIWDMLDKGIIDKNKKVLVIHCGGVFPGE